MCKVDELDYGMLLALRDAVVEEVAKYRPLYIKTRYKRCGKKECFCNDGPADGSRGNLHGPYVFAQFTSHKTGKTRTVSLGTHYDEVRRQAVSEKILDWKKYFTINPSEYMEMKGKGNTEVIYSYILTDREFEELYGVKPSEDQMDRHWGYYATTAKYQAYVSKKEALDEEKRAINDVWCYQYGIGSPTGQKVLRQLLNEYYYLAT